MTTYIVDQSVWSRVEHVPAITLLVQRIAREHTIVTCPPQVLEYCHAARSPTEYQRRRAQMNAFLALTRHPRSADVLDLQQALWDSGLMRAAGAVHVLIAAYAVANDATILSADRDFDALSQASGGRVRHQRVDVI
ncbi:hypothetical protein [Aeromicrobium sp. CTD01-1L150]|uniref:hypothetical protein n=1 Tax=Aeromicrobium sp. CTD01-1L150 TaxID=3341830 RepID=UPI0035C0D665